MYAVQCFKEKLCTAISTNKECYTQTACSFGERGRQSGIITEHRDDEPAVSTVLKTRNVSTSNPQQSIREPPARICSEGRPTRSKFLPSSRGRCFTRFGQPTASTVQSYVSSPTRKSSRSKNNYGQSPFVSSINETSGMDKNRRSSVGYTHVGSGLQTAVCPQTPSIQENDIFTGEWPSRGNITTGDNISVRQGCYTGGSEVSDEERVLFPLFLGEKEGGGATSYTGPQSPQSISESVSVQNVNDTDTPPRVTSESVSCQIGSERCLFSHSNIPTSQEIPTVRFQGARLRVSSTTVRTVTQPESFHALHESRDRSTEEQRRAFSSVSGRFITGRGFGTRSSASYSVGSGPLGEIGFWNQPRQERVDTLTDCGIPGHHSRLGIGHRSPVTRQNACIPVVPRAFQIGSEGFDRDMQTLSGAHGVHCGVNTIRQAAYETFPAMAGVTERAHVLPLPTSVSDRGMYECAALLARSCVPVGRRDYGDDYVQESGYDGRQSDRMGRYSRRLDGQRDVGRLFGDTPYQLFGADGGVSGAQTFPSSTDGLPRSSQIGQHHDGELYKQTRGTAVSRIARVGQGSTYLVRAPFVDAQSDAHTRYSELGSGPVVQRDIQVHGLVPPLSRSETDLGTVRRTSDRSFCVRREREVSVVLLDQGGVAYGDRCVSTRLAQGTALCVPSVTTDSSNTRESEEWQAGGDFNSAGMGAMGFGDYTSPVRPPVAPPDTQGSSNTGTGRDMPPPARTPGSMGLARERLNLSSAGLPQNVIDTIQSARAQSTRTVYDGKWRVFEEWCDEAHIVSFQAPIPAVLSFLQSLIDKGRTFATLKVYLAAISACHIGFDGKSVWAHPLVSRFMKGAMSKLRVQKSPVPSWDLALVLDSLTGAPFEPMGQVDMKFVSLKVALLLALVTTKRVSDLHALSVDADCTHFSEGKVTIKPNPFFVPKNPGAPCAPVVLREFHPPPFDSPEECRLHSLCPVRALRIYIDRSKPARQSDQLFVSWAARMVGKPITKQRLSHWIVEAIQLAYSTAGKQAPGRLRAHSTRGVAASWALFKGVSVQDLCAAASWSSPLTFARFYSLNVTAQPVAQAVLSVAPGRG